MPIAFVSGITVDTTGGRTSTVSLGTSSTAGNVFVLIISTYVGSASSTPAGHSSVSSNIGGTTWVKAATGAFTYSNYFYEAAEIWVAANIPTGNHTVTVDVGFDDAADYGKMTLAEFSGVVSVSPIDKTAIKSGDTDASQYATNLALAAASQPLELIVGAFSAANDPGTDAASGIVVPAGHTSLAYDPRVIQFNRAYVHSYKINNSTATETADWGTLTPAQFTSTQWGAALVSLKGATTGTSATPSGLTISDGASLASGGVVAQRRTTQAGINASNSAGLTPGSAVGVRRLTTSPITLASASFFAPGNTSNQVSSVPAGVVFSRDGTLIAGQGLGRRSVVVGGSAPNYFSFDSTVAQTFDSNQVGAFDSTGPSFAFGSQASLIAGTATNKATASPAGVVLSVASVLQAGIAQTGGSRNISGVTLGVGANLLFGSGVGRRVAAQAGNVYTVSKSLLTGNATAGTSAFVSGITFVTATGFTVPAPTTTTPGNVNGGLFLSDALLFAGTAAGFRATSQAGVTITANAGFVNRSQFYTFDSTSPTFDSNSNGLGFDQTNAVVAPSVVYTNAAVAGETFSRISAFNVGAASASKASNGASLSTVSAFIPGATNAGFVAAPNGVLLTATNSLSAGSASGINLGVIPGAVLAATTGLTAGSTTTAKAVAGMARAASGAFLAGIGGAQQLGTGGGEVFNFAATFTPGVAASSSQSAIAGFTFARQASFTPGNAVSLRQATTSGIILESRPVLQFGYPSSSNAPVAGALLAANGSFIVGNTTTVRSKTTPAAMLRAVARLLPGIGRGSHPRYWNGRPVDTAGALYQLLAPLVAPGLLIFTEQNGPRPPKSYTSLSVRMADPFSVINAVPDERGVQRVSQFQQFEVELQFYGDRSFERAQAVGLLIRTNTQALKAEALGLGVSRVNSANRVPALLNESQYEERGILEFTVYDSFNVDDEVGLIEQAAITSTSTTGQVLCEHVVDSPVGY